MLDRWIEPQRREALDELSAELAAFSYDGLLALEGDLRTGRVVRGSWAGCVLSYRRGAAGSSRRDRDGRTRNAVTRLWDRGHLTDPEVAEAVRAEIRRRRVRRDRRPAPLSRGPASAITLRA